MSDIDTKTLKDLYQEIYNGYNTITWTSTSYNQPVVLGYDHGWSFKVEQHPDANEPEILEEEW